MPQMHRDAYSTLVKERARVNLTYNDVKVEAAINTFPEHGEHLYANVAPPETNAKTVRHHQSLVTAPQRGRSGGNCFTWRAFEMLLALQRGSPPRKKVLGTSLTYLSGAWLLVRPLWRV